MIKTPRLHSAIVSYFGGLITGSDNFNLSNQIMDAARSGDYDKAHDLTLRHNMLDKNNTYQSYKKFPIRLFGQNIQTKMGIEHPEKVTKAMAMTHPAIKTIGLGDNALHAIASGNWDKVDPASMAKIHRALMEHGFGKDPLDISHIESYAKMAKAYNTTVTLRRGLRKASQHDRDPERQRKIDMDTSFFRKPKTYRGVHPDHEAIVRYFSHFSRPLPSESRATIMHDATLGEYGSAQRKLARRNDRLPAGLDGLKFGDYQIESVKTMDEKGIFKSFHKSVKKNKLSKAGWDDVDEYEDDPDNEDRSSIKLEQFDDIKDVEQRLNKILESYGMDRDTISESVINQLRDKIKDDIARESLGNVQRQGELERSGEEDPTDSNGDLEGLGGNDAEQADGAETEDGVLPGPDAEEAGGVLSGPNEPADDDNPFNLSPEELDLFNDTNISELHEKVGPLALKGKGNSSRRGKGLGAPRPTPLAAERWNSPYHNGFGEFVSSNGEKPVGPLFETHGDKHPSDWEETAEGQKLLNSLFPTRIDENANFDPNRNMTIFSGIKGISGNSDPSAEDSEVSLRSNFGNLPKKMVSWKVHIEKLLKRPLTRTEMAFINHHAYEAKGMAENKGYKAKLPTSSAKATFDVIGTMLQDKNLPNSIRNVFENVRKNPSSLPEAWGKIDDILDGMQQKGVDVSSYRETVARGRQLSLAGSYMEKRVVGDRAGIPRSIYSSERDRAKAEVSDQLDAIRREFFPASTGLQQKIEAAFKAKMREKGGGEGAFDAITPEEKTEILQQSLTNMDQNQEAARAEAAVRLGISSAKEIWELKLLEKEKPPTGKRALKQHNDQIAALRGRISPSDIDRWNAFMSRDYRGDTADVVKKYRELYPDAADSIVMGIQGGAKFRFDRHPEGKKFVERGFNQISDSIQSLPSNIGATLRNAISKRDTEGIRASFVDTDREINDLEKRGVITAEQRLAYRKILQDAEQHISQASGNIPSRSLKTEDVPEGGLFDSESGADLDRATHITPFDAMMAYHPEKKRGGASSEASAEKEFEDEHKRQVDSKKREIMNATDDPEEQARLEKELEAIEKGKEASKRAWMDSVTNTESLYGKRKTESEQRLDAKKRSLDTRYRAKVANAWSILNPDVMFDTNNYAAEAEGENGKKLRSALETAYALATKKATPEQTNANQESAAKIVEELLAARNSAGHPLIRNNGMLKQIYNALNTLRQIQERRKSLLAGERPEESGRRRDTLGSRTPLEEVSFGGVPVSGRNFVDWATGENTGKGELSPLDDENSVYHEIVKTITHKQDENGNTVPRYTPEDINTLLSDRREREKKGDFITPKDKAEYALVGWISRHQQAEKARARRLATLQGLRDDPDKLNEHWETYKDDAEKNIRGSGLSPEAKERLYEEISTPEGWLARQERSFRSADREQVKKVWEVIRDHPMANLLKGKIATQMMFRSGNVDGGVEGGMTKNRRALYDGDRSGLSDPDLPGRVGDPASPSGYPVARVAVLDASGKPTGRYTYQEFAPDAGRDPLLHAAHEQFQRNRAASAMTRDVFWPALSRASQQTGGEVNAMLQGDPKLTQWFRNFTDDRGALDTGEVKRFLRYQADKTGKYAGSDGSTFDEQKFNADFNKISADKNKLQTAFSQALYDASVGSHRTGGGGGKYDVPSLPSSFINKIHDFYHLAISKNEGDHVGNYMARRTEGIEQRADQRDAADTAETARKNKGRGQGTLEDGDQGGLARVNVKELPFEEAASQLLQDKMFRGQREGAGRTSRDLASGHLGTSESRRQSFNGHVINKVGEDLVPEEGETQTHGETPWSDRELLLAHALHSLRHVYPEYHHLENKTKDEDGNPIVDPKTGKIVHATSGGNAGLLHAAISQYIQGAATGNYDMMLDGAHYLTSKGTNAQYEGLQRADLKDQHGIPGTVRVSHLFKPVASTIRAGSWKGAGERTSKAEARKWTATALPQIRQAASDGHFDALKPVVSNYFKTAERLKSERPVAQVDPTAPVVPAAAAPAVVKAFAPTPFPFRIGAF
jgi:hypothetical protein